MGFRFKDTMLTAVMADSARYAFASQLAILRSCPEVIARILKTGDSLLRAAKLLVVSRLLHTKLSQHPNATPYLDTLRIRIGNLRRRLLSKIDRRYKSLDMSKEVLVEAMCAFSLATSSPATDVIRHYHHTRLEAISERMEESGSSNVNMLLALRLYVKTLRDSQALIPGRLANALEKLKVTSLIKSHDVNSIMELNLDVHERWIPEDIRNFIPYIRNDDLSKSEAERTSKQWAKQAFSEYLSGLRRKTQNLQDFQTLLHVRQEILELWLSNQRHSLGLDMAETLDGLRDVFNAQAVNIIQSRASTLNRVGLAVQNVLHGWQPGISDPALSLWDPSMTSTGMTKGGREFRERLTNRSLGKNDSLDQVARECHSFLKKVRTIEDTITGLRETKWADDVVDVDDDDELSDNKQALLSKDDPALLQDTLSDALQRAYVDLQALLTNLCPGEAHDHRSQKSSFLIRVWRELRQSMPESYQNSHFGLDAIPALQNNVAREVLGLPLKRRSKRLLKIYSTSGLQTKPLWEGDPPLPVMPSAWTYRFLLDIVSAMTASGSDTWTPHAVDILKREITRSIVIPMKASMEALVSQINGHLNGGSPTPDSLEKEAEKVDEEDDIVRNVEEYSETHTNGDEPTGPTDGQANGTLSNGIDRSNATVVLKDVKTQTLFDVSYFINATVLKERSEKHNELIQLQEKIAGEVDLESRSVQRIKRDAGEYWKRTSLLFGLLA